MSVFEGGEELSQEQMESLVADEISRRRMEYGARDVAVAGAAGGAAAHTLKNTIHRQASKGLTDEFQDIRNDPALNASNFDKTARTYERYLEKGNNPVEYFMDMPGTDYWAAGQLKSGDDVVFYDSTAFHPGVMAHELGHTQMNHSSDPLSFLQRSGLGRASGDSAFTLGAAGAALGALTGQIRARGKGKEGRDPFRSQVIGTGVGGAIGAVGASGMAAYEAEASRRALGYLPDDVDALDTMGDLGRAHSTYLMAGPGTALVTALGVGSALAAAAHPGTRAFVKRMATEHGMIQNSANAPSNANTTVGRRHAPA